MRKKASQKCNDENCPFHGSLKTRGKGFIGTVVSTKMQKTAIVEWGRRHYLRKYERYEKRRSMVKVHNPSCINAKEGDSVKIIECRPLSKTKNFVIIGVLGKEKGFKERMEAREEAKVVKKEKGETKEVEDAASQSKDN